MTQTEPTKSKIKVCSQTEKEHLLKTIRINETQYKLR